MNHQAVASVYYRDERIGTVRPIHMNRTNSVQIFGHSGTAWSRGHAAVWRLPSRVSNVRYPNGVRQKRPVRFPAQFGHSASVQTRTARIIQAALRNISRVIYGSNLMLNHMHTIIMNASNATVNQNKNVCSSRENNHLSLTHNIVRLIYPVLNPFFIFITANIMPIIKISICSYSGRWI